MQLLLFAVQIMTNKLYYKPSLGILLAKNQKSNAEKVRVPFVIAVPSACRSKVREVFKKLEIPWKDNIHVLEL